MPGPDDSPASPAPATHGTSVTAPRAGLGLSRRDALRLAGLGGASTAALLLKHAVVPPRAYAETAWERNSVEKSDVQYDIGDFLPPPLKFRGIDFELAGPVHTRFVPARLLRTPSQTDRSGLTRSLATIEAAYEWLPRGVFVFVSYGLPYFDRLPARAVAAHMPLLLDSTRPVLEEAVPAPSDIQDGIDPVGRRIFTGPDFSVHIESHDLLLTLRSDDLAVLDDVEGWLRGDGRLKGRDVPSPAFGGLLAFAETRSHFVQIGLPRAIAEANRLPFADSINPESPMWMGQADQQVNGAGPAAITCFQGNRSARLARFPDAGRYFLNGTIQHLSHGIMDLETWYHDPASAEFRTQLQLMFRATHAFGNGGGSPFWKNEYYGRRDAEQGAAGDGTPDDVHRIGHLTALQRSSRAPDGTPIHKRLDGPGLDTMDTAGNLQPGPLAAKSQFSMFMPTADFFRRMRENQAALDLVARREVARTNNGIERFVTPTRRQNFLMPPRRHRAFPLLEFS